MIDAVTIARLKLAASARDIVTINSVDLREAAARNARDFSALLSTDATFSAKKLAAALVVLLLFAIQMSIINTSQFWIIAEMPLLVN